MTKGRAPPANLPKFSSAAISKASRGSFKVESLSYPSDALLLVKAAAGSSLEIKTDSSGRQRCARQEAEPGFAVPSSTMRRPPRRGAAAACSADRKSSTKDSQAVDWGVASQGQPKAPPQPLKHRDSTRGEAGLAV